MRANYLALAAAICALVPVAGRAQQTPAAENVVEALVVRPAGPAWWRVSRGDSVVWLLSVPRGLPKDMAWERTRMEQRVAGAREVILAPRWRIREREVMALLKARNAPGVSSETLPPEVSAGRERAAEAAGLSAKRYREGPTPITGLRLSNDAARRWKISGAGVREQVEAAARRSKTPIRAVVFHTVADVPKDAPLPPAAEGVACMEESAAFVSAGPAPLRAEAEAWAVGDYRRVFEAGRGRTACLRSVPGMPELLARIRAEHLADVEGALGLPGYAVALATTDALTAPEGLLAQLRAKGYAVRGPDQ